MRPEYVGYPNNDVQDAGGDRSSLQRVEDMKWPLGWPLTRIPTTPRYIEALLLHWVRYKDIDKELCWFFKLYDILASDSCAYPVLNRMERHCRHIMETLGDHMDWDKDYRYPLVLKRDILLQAEKLLWKRAAGPLYHDPHGWKARSALKMPPRNLKGPLGWDTEDHSWKQEVAPTSTDNVDEGSSLPSSLTQRMRDLRYEFEMS